MAKKTVLSLIEQTVMICVFAVAAALCLSVFVYARELSEKNGIRDFAVREVSNAAQIMRSCSGDLEKASVLLDAGECPEGIAAGYDADFCRVDSDPEFVLRVVPVKTENKNLGSAEITFDRASETVYSLNICWQEDPS